MLQILWITYFGYFGIVRASRKLGFQIRTKKFCKLTSLRWRGNLFDWSLAAFPTLKDSFRLCVSYKESNVIVFHNRNKSCVSSMIHSAMPAASLVAITLNFTLNLFCFARCTQKDGRTYITCEDSQWSLPPRPRGSSNRPILPLREVMEQRPLLSRNRTGVKLSQYKNIYGRMRWQS